MNPYTRTLCLVLCASAGSAFAQPTFESPSPTQGSSTSQKANEMADKGMYKPVEYANAAKPGPAIIVIPGEVKSNNASFAQKFGPNNIADFAELELGKANFKVLERSNLGPLLQEFQLAYNLGDPQTARKYLQKGKLKTTKWVMKFDILKAEQVAQAQSGFSGRPIGALIGIFGGGRGAAAGDVVVSSVDRSNHVLVLRAPTTQGFDLATKRRDSQFGLRNMETRARLMGGTLDLQSTPGEGTSVCVALPLALPDAD